MKIIANDRLTIAWLQKLKRYNTAATVLSVLLVAFSLFWMLLRLGGKDATIHFDDITFSLAALIGAVWTFQSIYRGMHGPVRIDARQFLVWWLFGGALLLIYMRRRRLLCLSGLCQAAPPPITFRYPLQCR